MTKPHKIITKQRIPRGMANTILIAVPILEISSQNEENKKPTNSLNPLSSTQLLT